MSVSSTLVGVIADFRGDEGHAIVASAVVEIEGQRFVAQTDEWDVRSLKPLKPSQETFVTPIRARDRRPINPGELVWLAGPKFVNDVRNFHALRAFSFRLGAWPVLRYGFRWEIGSRTAFSDMNGQIAAEVEKLLHGLLFDALEKTFDEAERAFRLYAALQAPPSRDRYRTLGLYYFETRDAYGYDTVAIEAVALRYFESREAFAQDVTRLRGWLKERRLSEIGAPALLRNSTASSTLNVHELEAWAARISSGQSSRKRYQQWPQRENPAGEPLDLGAGNG